MMGSSDGLTGANSTRSLFSDVEFELHSPLCKGWMDEFQDAAMAFISGGVPCAKDCTILASREELLPSDVGGMMLCVSAMQLQ